MADPGGTNKPGVFAIACYVACGLLLLVMVVLIVRSAIRSTPPARGSAGPLMESAPHKDPEPKGIK